MSAQTAREAGLIACHFCDTLCEIPHNETESDIENLELSCPCCKSQIHSRIPNSLSKTWALLIAAIILYIPANTLPIMTVVLWGDGQPDTIMSGVIHLMDGGMWPLALLIFVASIFIPILKLIILTGLMLSIYFKSHWKPRDRTVLYRITEFVGRWSMIDIFVIGILVSLVQFGNTASVSPGIGSLSFAAVVVLTMFAAHTFDPRLIWDVIDDKKKEQYLSQKVIKT
jgi:paraquat-inducible protein A